MSTIKNLPKDNSDRNRTSPIAFTGNKFEFRMLGSSMNASFLNTVINTSLAKVLDEIADELDKVKNRQDVREKALDIIASMYKKHKRIVFSGNGYSDEWVKEAERRGLPNVPTFIESIKCFSDKDCISTFEKYGVYTEKEIMARSEIMYESYVHVRSIEIRTLTAMIYQNIIPSAIKELNFITTSGNEYMSSSMRSRAEKLSTFIDECSLLAGQSEDELKASLDEASFLEKGMHILKKVIPLTEELRKTADKMEHYISIDNLPYPSYEKLFFDTDF